MRKSSVPMRLGDIAYARSGDKGSSASSHHTASSIGTNLTLRDARVRAKLTRTTVACAARVTIERRAGESES